MKGDKHMTREQMRRAAQLLRWWGDAAAHNCDASARFEGHEMCELSDAIYAHLRVTKTRQRRIVP